MLAQVIDRESLQSADNTALALTFTPATKHKGSAILVHSVEVVFSAVVTTVTITITRIAHTGAAADDRIIFTKIFTNASGADKDKDFIWSPAENPVMDLYLLPDEQLKLDVGAAGASETSFGFIYYELVS